MLIGLIDQSVQCVVDSGSPHQPILTTTLSVANGELSLAASDGIEFLNGTGNGGATLTFSGLKI